MRQTTTVISQYRTFQVTRNRPQEPMVVDLLSQKVRDVRLLPWGITGNEFVARDKITPPRRRTRSSLTHSPSPSLVPSVTLYNMHIY